MAMRGRKPGRTQAQLVEAIVQAWYAAPVKAVSWVAEQVNTNASTARKHKPLDVVEVIVKRKLGRPMGIGNDAPNRGTVAESIVADIKSGVAVTSLVELADKHGVTPQHVSGICKRWVPGWKPKRRAAKPKVLKPFTRDKRYRDTPMPGSAAERIVKLFNTGKAKDAQTAARMCGVTTAAATKALYRWTKYEGKKGKRS